MSLEARGPATLPHKFESDALVNHFSNKPLPEGACALIDLPGDVFLDTEDEVNVIAASVWVLCVKYDRIPAGDKPTNRENLRRWITKYREDAINSLAGKVEPPFHAWTVNQIEKDVSQMVDEVLARTIPVDKDAKAKK